jgi:hypothetical protein
MEEDEKPKRQRKPKAKDGNIIWVRPSGTDIETNSEKATIEYAEANGWKRK